VLFCDLRSPVDPRDQRIAELEAVVAAQAAVIIELNRKVEELTLLVGKLMEKAAQNSRNSHLPPSSDGPGARSADNQRTKASQRNRGGQRGHAGHKRGLLPLDQVSRVIDIFPKECENCWAPLPELLDPNASRFQVTEIPSIQPETTEFRAHSVRCSCGYTTHAKVDGVVPVSPFGPRLMSLIALFTGVYHLSRRKTVAVLRDVLGTDISLGAISTVEARVSAAVKPVVDEAWTKAENATVKHTDATSWLQCGKLRSLWTIATKLVTVFKIVRDGSADTVKPLFGACTGILVSDRATVFTFWPMTRRQVCWAHLLRKFIAFSERAGPIAQFGQELLDYAELVFRYWHDYRAGKIDRTTFRAWMAPVRLQVEACLDRAVAANIENLSGSCADILAHQMALWTFVERTDVEPTNNHAERELRAFVLWRKRCFGAQSDRGNQFAERVMTVAHTARKQNKNVLAFLTSCCEARLAKTAAPSLFAAQFAAV
jgi:transposase